MTFEQAVDYLSSLGLRGWRLGLDRMEEFLRRAGLDDMRSGTRYVHIAGTNGKGSTTAYVQSILSAAGFRTGGFFSPYVYDITERIQFGGKSISQTDFARLVAQLRPVADSFDESDFGGVTEFEFKTAMGLAYWRERQAEWVALEVGLGGRLDATNVVRPACAVIVSIGLDHTSILGNTLAEIAREKAGIFKPGIPAVIGELEPHAAAVAREVASGLGCPLWEMGKDFTVEPASTGWRIHTPSQTVDGLVPRMAGPHQVHNMAVAVASLVAANAIVSISDFQRGVRDAVLPGRFEVRTVREKTVVLDGAHNVDSIRALASNLAANFPGQQFTIVFGMLEGHDPAPVVRLLEPFAKRVHLAPIDFRRTLDPHSLADHFLVPVEVCPDAASAFNAALELAEPILVTGSFYLVGEVGREIPSSNTSAQ